MRHDRKIINLGTKVFFGGIIAIFFCDFFLLQLYSSIAQGVNLLFFFGREQSMLLMHNCLIIRCLGPGFTVMALGPG